MKDGVVQQIDTPQNLYDHPCNKFVAGFIGSPQMNMITAEAAEENGEVVLHFEGQRVILNKERAAALRNGGYIGQKVILGIRPEDIHEYADAAELGIEKATVGMNVTVTAREMLGAEVFLYFDEQKKTHAVRLHPKNQTMTGEKIDLYFDPKKIHLFDQNTEESIFYREETV